MQVSWLEIWREIQPYLSERDVVHMRSVALLRVRKTVAQAARLRGTSLVLYERKRGRGGIKQTWHLVWPEDATVLGVFYAFPTSINI